MSKYQSKYTGKQIDDALDKFSTFSDYRMKLTKDLDGSYLIERGKEYRVFIEIQNGVGTFQVVLLGSTNKITPIDMTIDDPYADSAVFRWLDCCRVQNTELCFGT